MELTRVGREVSNGGLLVVLLAVGVGLAVGAAASFLHPLVLLGALLAPVALALLLSNTQVGLIAVVLIIYLLPFGVIPVPLGSVKLTFLDVTLSLLLVVWVGRLLVKTGERLETSAIGGMVALFIGLALVSFTMGLSYAPIASETVRLFLKAINSVLLFFTVINCVRERSQLEQLARALILAGAGAGAVALFLVLVEHSLAIRLLSSLRVLGYPSGPEVLRFIASTDIQRATGTSVDPNILGAALMISSALGISQLLSPRPLIRRSYLVPLIGLMVAALLLSYSRSSWVGLLAALAVVATLKERRLWLLFGVMAIAVYFGGTGEERGFTAHLQSGIMAQDQASAMRLGEYRDALRLIERYPWFGVGFGGAPSVDLYVGVSNIYLLLAEQMGLIGLGSFLLVVVGLYLTSLRRLSQIGDSGLQMLVVGFLACTTAALCAGLFDHYFVNLRFPHTVALFWLLVALCVTAVRIGMDGEVSSARGN